MLSHRVSLPLPIVLALCATGVSGALLFAQSSKDVEPKRPKVTVRAQPSVSIAPARVVLTAELVGGSDDFEEYYCPTIAWDWGDDTISEATADCEPFEAGKSQIRRRYTIQHVFKREGPFKIYFHMKRKDKILGSASTVIQVQPGAIRSF